MPEERLAPNQLFATPAIWTPEKAGAEWEWEVEQMLIRADATEAWLQGELSVSDYLDLLDSQQIDVFSLPDYWGLDAIC